MYIIPKSKAFVHIKLSKIKYKMLYIERLNYNRNLIVAIDTVNVNVFHSSSSWTISMVSISFLVGSSIFDPMEKTSMTERQWKQEVSLTYGKPYFFLHLSFQLLLIGPLFLISRWL